MHDVLIFEATGLIDQNYNTCDKSKFVWTDLKMSSYFSVVISWKIFVHGTNIYIILNSFFQYTYIYFGTNKEWDQMANA